MGGVETKLKLIACQRNDQSWSIVSNESITIDEATDFGDGALTIVNLGVNRQIQGNVELASPKIVGILKNFSRLLEKTKDQEQEIEQWKNSLERQSEELSLRQIEMETRLEQVEQMEEEFKQFEQQKAEITAAKAETDEIRAEFEAKSSELQGAWEQLQGQQENLNEQLQNSKILDESQAATIKSHLEVLSTLANSQTSLKSNLESASSMIQNQQEILQPHWQNLDQSSQDIQAKRQELEQTVAELADKKQQIESLISAIAETEKKLGIENQSLKAKQDLTSFLNTQSESQALMLEMLVGSDTDSAEQKVNLKELENMPLPNLEETVESLKKDLEKVARFVNDQEEELGWQCKAVEELEQKISQMGEFERFTVEQELADELEAKKMLDKTLVGQRRSLKERHHILLQHSRILKRRQGIVDFDFESDIQDIDLAPIKRGLEEQQQKLQKQQQNLAEEVTNLESSIQSLESELEQQQSDKSNLESTLATQQESWQKLNAEVIQMQFQIGFYEQQLQPLQDGLDTIKTAVSEMEELFNTDSQTDPIQATSEISNIINDLSS